MAFTSILAVSNRTNASGQSPGVAVPAGLAAWTLRIDLAVPNTFTDPVNQHLVLQVQYSFDGGVNWQDIAGGTIDGSATSLWGKNFSNPSIVGNVPTDPAYPTNVRGSYQQIGTFSFGLSIEVR